MSERPGRDRKAVRHRPAPPVRTPTERPHVLVVGAGIAGMAAAATLAERDVAVTLLEQHDELGGRVRSWQVDDGAGTTTMSRGFHAFFRQYYNLRALLRRADPDLRHLVPVADYPLLAGDGSRDSFTDLPRTPPWSIAAFVLRSPTFPLRALPAVDVSAALELLDVSFPATLADYDGESAAHFLDRLRFPAQARHLALEVFSRSFFAAPDEFSAGELVSMFHTYFLGSSEGLLFDVPDDDYASALWEPLRDHLLGLDVDVRTGVTVDDVATDTAGVHVHANGQSFDADALVLATDPRSTRRLVGESDLGDDRWRAQVAATRNAPPFAVWRLWLAKPVAADRTPFLGTAGFDLLDNISVLERFEAGAAGWAARTGGSVVELHAYALAPTADPADVRRRMRAALDRIYPETRDVDLRAEQWLLQDDCPLIGTEPWSSRPPVATPDPRVVLAGDWVRCDYPVALMERAATTGLLAANELLRRSGRTGCDIWTVPMHGRHRVVGPVHRLLTRRARALVPRDRRPVADVLPRP